MGAQNCTLFPDAPEKCTTLAAVKKTMGAFSILGSLFILVVIVLFRKYRYFEQRLILYLSISSFFRAFGYIMSDVYPEYDRSKACVFEAWWLVFFGHCVLAWVSCITFNLYFSVVRKTDTTKFEKYYLVIAWVIPFIIACLPLSGTHYGPAGQWCWIRRDTENASAWRFATWYVPLFTIILIMFVAYTYIFIVLRRQVKAWVGLYSAEAEQNKELMNKHIKPLRFYPFVYLILSIFPLVHRILNAVASEAIFPLMVLHTISNPLVGFANGIVFGMDRETLSRLNYVQIKAALLSWIPHRNLVIKEYPLQTIDETPERQPSNLGSTIVSSVESAPPLPQNSNPKNDSSSHGPGSETVLHNSSLTNFASLETTTEAETPNGKLSQATGNTQFEEVTLD